jgi:tRNA modification GTPase
MKKDAFDFSMEDTICAISTPMGIGAIGMVRLSGAEAITITARVFRAHDRTSATQLKTHTLKYGHIVKGSQPIDEVLLTVMRAPATYTRQDMVEIHCHGGLAAVRAVLEVVLAQGARLAHAGEFTKRAFLNGRIDLTQASAVLEIIESRTRDSLSMANSRLSGRLSQQIVAIREDLLETSALLEASIDFPDEELPDLIPDAIARAKAAQEKIHQLLASADSGRLYRQGVSVVLAGKPNVGKSSIFNQMLRQARAIVTDEPGTTRDVIEETVNIQGVPVRLIDSAGLRSTDSRPEQIGVEHARRAIEQADLVLLVLDTSRPLEENDHQAAALVTSSQRPCLVVLNKADLPQAATSDQVAEVIQARAIATSTLDSASLALLEKAIANAICGDNLLPATEALVASAWESECLNRASLHIDEFNKALLQGLSPEVAALDLQNVLDALGEMIGEITSDDLMDKIFGRFCIGK